MLLPSLSEDLYFAPRVPCREIADPASTQIKNLRPDDVTTRVAALGDFHGKFSGYDVRNSFYAPEETISWTVNASATSGQWADVAFHHLRTQGAFLGSTKRKAVSTQFVTVESPLSLSRVVRMPIPKPRIYINGTTATKEPVYRNDVGFYEVRTARGDTATFTPVTLDKMDLLIEPIPLSEADRNLFGLNKSKPSDCRGTPSIMTNAPATGRMPPLPVSGLPRIQDAQNPGSPHGRFADGKAAMVNRFS